MRDSETPKDQIFENFVKEFRLDAARFAISLLGSSPYVDDVVAEAFMTAWKKWEDRPQPELLKSWIFTMTRNQCMNQIRSEKAWRSRDDAYARSRLSSDFADAAVVAQAEKLAQALDNLDDGEFDLVVLVYWDQLSHQEVAKLIGFSAEAVAMRISRLRRKLREVMERVERPNDE